MLTEEQRQACADRLRDAERERRPIPPLVEEHPELDAVDAYAIQLTNIRRRRAQHAVVGHKVGLSSAVMQRMMGVDEPDYGHLLADMELSEAVPADPALFCQPRVEVEVGYLIGADLPGADCAESDVLDSTRSLVPAIELIDSRIRNWQISLGDTIADNASSAAFVLGQQRFSPREVDPQKVDVSLSRDGEPVQRGRSDAVLGDPTTAVAWLARKLSGFGTRLRAGDLVLPGSCVRAVDVVAGSTYEAAFEAGGANLGSVRLSFAATGSSSGGGHS